MGAECKRKGVVNAQLSAAITKSFPQPSICGLSRYYPRVGGRGCEVDSRLLREGMIWWGYGTTKPAGKAVLPLLYRTLPDMSPLPTMLINWLYCQSKHSEEFF